MIDVLPAVAAALIWAYASVSYKSYVEELGVFSLNFLRMAYAAAALAVPSLLLGLGGGGAAYAAVSGVLSLVVGDSLYLKAIQKSGVSVAVPAAYTYVLMEQFVAVTMGEPLKATYLVAGALVVFGVYLLAAGGGGRGPAGIPYALGAALAWALGYAAVKAAGVGGVSPISIAFLRVATALPVLAALNRPAELVGGLKRTWRSALPVVAALDLGGGSALFAYSATEVGLGLTVIITGVAPLASQLIARALGRERPSAREYAAAAAIFLAIAITSL